MRVLFKTSDRSKTGFIACLLAFIQITVSVCMLFPVRAKAGEQLGENNFDNGKGLPWHIMESMTGKMDFEIEDGVYRITIINPGGRSAGGEDRWDCQFRHRGLKIVSGHTYHVHYEMRSSNSGRYYTKIGNLEGNVELWHNMSNGYDFDSTWDLISINANEWKIVDLDFTATQSLDVAEWAFHLGGDGEYTNGVCFPAGTVIEFDNMSLVDKTSDENDYVPEPEWERAGILTNQLGYFADFEKKATLLSDSSSEIKFSLVDESGSEVYSGKSEVFGLDEDSGDMVHILDFSKADKPGIYKLVADDGKESREFKIGVASEYSSMLYDSLNFFYQNRSGIDIESQYISSGDPQALARSGGHMNDNGTVLNVWGYNGPSENVEGTGGWYDAGDHGKYVVNGGISVWLLQNMYELALYSGTESVFSDGKMLIPENSNSYPDILDETRWEMEWILKMQVNGGEYDGMAYHKLHDEKWTGLAVAPADDPQPRVVYPPTTAATLNLAACAAQSARLWKGIDDAFSGKCLDAAVKAFDAALAHPDMYAAMEDAPGGGPYGDDDASDEFYWAACELYITTGEKTYLDHMKKSEYYCSVLSELKGGESVNTFGTFDWGHTATLGTLSLLITDNDLPGGDIEKAEKSLVKAADAFVKAEDAQGYGLPYSSSTLSYKDSSVGYLWGSNSFVLDNAVVISYAYIRTGNTDYINGAICAMDYILGRNANDYSYVTGYGMHASKYPHHRFWAYLVDENFPMAPSGILVGGPNSGMEDPWVKGSGWKKGQIPPAKCYLDHIEAYSVNECAINWNASLAWMTAFVASNTEGVISASYGSAAPASDEGQAQTPVAGSDSQPVVASTAPDTPANNGPDTGSTHAEDTSMAGVLLAAIIVFGVVALVVPTEIFIYKMVKMNREGKKTDEKSGKE